MCVNSTFSEPSTHGALLIKYLKCSPYLLLCTLLFECAQLSIINSKLTTHSPKCVSFLIKLKALCCNNCHGLYNRAMLICCMPVCMYVVPLLNVNVLLSESTNDDRCFLGR